MGVFTGTKRLTRLALRRDRVKLPIWIIAIVGLLAMMLPALSETYGSLEERVLYQTMLSTSAIGKLFAGTVDSATFGAIVTAETMIYVGLAIAFMNVLLIVRHTRHNEELGSSELLQSARVGRFSALTAALLLALAANAVVAVGLAVVLGGHDEITWSQAWLYGIGQGLLGMTFAAVAAITAQLSSSSRGASSMTAIVIGATFLLRGVGDVFAKTGADGLSQPLWPSFLSPFGWLQLARPLTEQQWWALVLPAVFIIGASLFAYSLLTRRDVGSGILPARAGAPEASHALLAASPIGLAVRLQKGAFIGWLIGAVVMAAVMGGMVQEMLGFIEESEVMRDYVAALGGTGGLAEIFLSAMLALVAMVLIAYVVQSMQRLRAEEVRGYAESLLATALGRTKWALSHATVVVFGALIILIVSGLALAISAGLASGSAFSEWELWPYTLAALSYLPALLLFVGIAVFSFGLLPKAATLIAWLAFTYVIFIGQLGVLLKLPDSFMNASPFAHIAAAPAADIVWKPLIILTAIALGLLLLGLIAFRRRSLQTS